MNIPNTAEIEAKIMHEFRWKRRCCPIAPSIVLPHRWEADVAACTKSGFVHEFEIKVSRSDFKADFLKGDENDRKHDRMANKKNGFVREQTDYEKRHDYQPTPIWTPNYFWFCSPIGLLKIDDIPEYAGFIEFRTGSLGSVQLIQTKNAPRLHGQKHVNERLLKMFLERLTNIVVSGRGGNYNAVGKPKPRQIKTGQISLFGDSE